MAGRGTSYTQEFRNSAIQLSLNSEKSPHAISKELRMCIVAILEI